MATSLDLAKRTKRLEKRNCHENCFFVTLAWTMVCSIAALPTLKAQILPPEPESQQICNLPFDSTRKKDENVDVPSRGATALNGAVF